jgi:GNAT superfamily N-acetyltransferase
VAAQWAIRPALPDEAPFFVDAWQRSFLDAAMEALPFVGHLHPRHYRQAQRVVADRLLRRSVVLVAHLEAVPEEVCGYVVFEGGALHWLYVKHAFRNAGCARALLREATREGELTAHTHETKPGRALAKKLGSTFTPKLAR